MHAKTVDITGQKFGRLLALRVVGKSKIRHTLWEFKCDCGKIHVAAGAYVRNGDTKSCGCLHDEQLKAGRELFHKGHTIHGLSSSLTGVSHTSMLQRCYNPKTKAYPAYGGVGIKPCEFIRSNLLNLILCIGERTSKDLSLDRIDNNFGYCCGSCAECLSKGWSLNIRWATRKQQSRNRKFCKKMTINGVEKGLGEWAEELNLPITTIRYRQWKQEQEKLNAN